MARRTFFKTKVKAVFHYQFTSSSCKLSVYIKVYMITAEKDMQLNRELHSGQIYMCFFCGPNSYFGVFSNLIGYTSGPYEACIKILKQSSEQVKYYPRVNGAKRRSGRKPGAKVTNSALRSSKSLLMGGGMSLLISTTWRTIVSDSFDWLTRLFFVLFRITIQR